MTPELNVHFIGVSDGKIRILSEDMCEHVAEPEAAQLIEYISSQHNCDAC